MSPASSASPTAPGRSAPRPRRTAACVHHWLIEPAIDAQSQGRCRDCGARRVFSNRYAEPERDAEASAWQHRAATGRPRV